MGSLNQKKFKNNLVI